MYVRESLACVAVGLPLCSLLRRELFRTLSFLSKSSSFFAEVGVFSATNHSSRTKPEHVDFVVARCGGPLGSCKWHGLDARPYKIEPPAAHRTHLTAACSSAIKRAQRVGRLAAISRPASLSSPAARGGYSPIAASAVGTMVRTAVVVSALIDTNRLALHLPHLLPGSAVAMAWTRSPYTPPELRPLPSTIPPLSGVPATGLTQGRHDCSDSFARISIACHCPVCVVCWY